jgi:hypothetical protein
MTRNTANKIGWRLIEGCAYCPQHVTELNPPSNILVLPITKDAWNASAGMITCSHDDCFKSTFVHKDLRIKLIEDEVDEVWDQLNERQGGIYQGGGGGSH